jgi:phosphatidylserine synthase
MVSFCVAPLIAVYVFYNTSFEVTVENIAILFSCGIFLIGGMLHLIRYHIGDEGYFVGLATPAAAMTVIAVIYFSPQWWCISLVLFVLSVIMMSSIPYPKMGGVLSVPAVVVILLTVAFGNELYILLLAGIVLYIILGPLYVSHGLKTSAVSDDGR